MTGGLGLGGLLETRPLGCVALKEVALEATGKLGGPSGGQKSEGGAFALPAGAGTGPVDFGFLGGCLGSDLFLPSTKVGGG